VPKVELARDVRGWVRVYIDRPVVVGVGGVEALLLPGALPALLDAFGLVERFHQRAILALMRKRT
jgi:hypothetical protein